jgi:hypothetical protein
MVDYKKELDRFLEKAGHLEGEYHNLLKGFFRSHDFEVSEKQERQLANSVRGEIFVQLLHQVILDEFPEVKKKIEHEPLIAAYGIRADLGINGKIFIEVKSGGSRIRKDLEERFKKIIHEDKNKGRNRFHCIAGFGYDWEDLDEHKRNLRKLGVEVFIMQYAKDDQGKPRRCGEALERFLDYVGEHR